MVGEFISNFASAIANVYSSIETAFPGKYRPVLQIALYTVFLVIYCIATWKFYRFLAKRDILELNLGDYNSVKHEFLKKIAASCLFILEYIIIMPFIIMVWFTIFALFILVMAKNQSVQNVILISAAIVASTRILSYYSEDLSGEMAKLFPLNLLALFIIDATFFSTNELSSRFAEIPLLIENIAIYLVAILFLEVVLRGYYALVLFVRSED